VEWISKTEFVTLTPNFRKYGPKKVDVYILIDEDLISVTKTDFSFYVDTMCEKSCTYGPGIHSVQNAGEETVFIINARDEDGNNRTSGRDEWLVSVVDRNTKQEVETEITDDDNGTYYVKYTCPEPTEVSVNVSIVDCQGTKKTINGCPYKVKFIDFVEENRGLNSLEGSLIVNFIRDKTDELRHFIDERHTALDIEKRNYIEDVHILLDIKKNYTQCIKVSLENERTLDQL